MYLKNGKDQMTFWEKHLKGKYVIRTGTIVDARGNPRLPLYGAGDYTGGKHEIYL